MADTTPAEMDREERDEFLGTGGTGVISFSSGADTPPHTLPVSYGYDEVDSTFYVRLAVDGDSEKGDPDDRPVSFVTYGQVDGEYRSVVATGRLVSTTEDDVDNEALAGLRRVHIPLVDIFGERPANVEFEFYRLDPDNLTTRKESSTAP